MRLFCRVEYDGTAFCGWQKQPDARTVQGEIEQALATILRRPVPITGAGRTDAGVHAIAQAFHFDLWEKRDTGKLTYSLNSLLPPEIGLYNMKVVDDSLHARFSARERSYRYCIISWKSPLLRNRAAHIRYNIDWDIVRRELALIRGTHSFTGFCAAGCYTDNHVCTVTDAELITEESGMRVIKIRADRFVYKMVRTIVGTLIDLGRGRLKGSVADIFEHQNRDLSGITAPPEGLYFENVTYHGYE
ncbi:MAG: tRNA pseudouridine(38-40) synthase TruA [Fibrobacterota bacterium]